MIRSEVPWLRLVYDSLDIPVFPASKEKDARQLSFPFPEPDIIVVIDVAKFQYISFKSALNKIKPRWIFFVVIVQTNFG